MNEPIQYVNIVYFDVDANRLETQMENFEKSRTRYVQTWYAMRHRLWASLYQSDDGAEGDIF